MLILDFHKWNKLKLPIICERFKDERCPCLQNCIIVSNCTKSCSPMQDHIHINVSETLSYLKVQMRKEYYNKIEYGTMYRGSDIFNELVNLCYHTVLQDDGIYEEWACIMKRFYYTMKRSYQIAVNRCKLKPHENIDHFFIGM